MSSRNAARKLAKFLHYILGRRPDEFGLIPDTDGYVRIKDLLKALNEEDGWRHVRRAHLKEIVSTLPDPPIEIHDNAIRATQREMLPENRTPGSLPKLLYTGIRRRAYPHVAEKGLAAHPPRQVILSADREMAERIAKRGDGDPVMLTVQTRKAEETGTRFTRSGETIYLAEKILPECFTGPPLPKKDPAPKKQEVPVEKAAPTLPGSFIWDVTEEKVSKRRGKRKEKDLREKKNRRRKRERPPWKE